jgi:polysaccharide export outer membrane protein
MKESNKVLLFLFIFLTSTSALIASEANQQDLAEPYSGAASDTYYKENLRDSLYQEGMVYFNQAKYEEALVKFQEALHWDMQYQPALTYIELSRGKIAQLERLRDEKVSRSKELKEKQAKVYSSRQHYKTGLAYFNSKDYPRAIEEFNQSLKWDPQYQPAVKYIELSGQLIEKERKIQEERIAQENKAREDKKRLQEEKRKANEIRIVDRGKINEDKTAYQHKLQEAKQGLGQEVAANQITAKESAAADITYRIEKDDVLEIGVWGYPQLTREVIVRPDGKISYPFLGDLKAGGLTLPELKDKIISGLNEFVKRRFSLSDKSEGAGYLISIGDLLDISVWRVPDLSKDVIVRPDGMISFPLVGDLKAAGITLAQLDNDLTLALGKYVKEPQVAVMVKSFGWKKSPDQDVRLEENPEVSVIIKKLGGNKVIILGDVIRPGVYTFTGQIRLVEAIALAGDFTKYAVKNNVIIIRGDLHNNPEIISSNINSFLKEGSVGENILIQSQDVIFVPRSMIGNINNFLEIISPVIDTIYKGAVIPEVINN